MSRVTHPQRRLVGAPPRHAELRRPRGRPPGAGRRRGRRPARPAPPHPPRRRPPDRVRARPRTTSTTSPRTSRAANSSAASASVPRQTSSCSLVNSRTTATPRCGSAAASSANVAATRPGASRTTVVRSSVKSAATRWRRAEPLRGKNPSTAKRSRGQSAHDEGAEHRRGTGDGADDLARRRHARRPAGHRGPRSPACPRRSPPPRWRHPPPHPPRARGVPPRCARAARASGRLRLRPPGSPTRRAGPACDGCPRSR